MAGEWRKRLVLGLALSAMLAACDTLMPLLPVVHKETPITADHWELKGASDGITIAGVMASGSDTILQVACYDDTKARVLMLAPKQAPKSEGGERRLFFAFDGGEPVEQSWNSEGLGYAVWDAAAAFQPALDALKAHGTLDAMITEDGTEIARAHFTLQGAAQAIDAVTAACGKPAPR